MDLITTGVSASERMRRENLASAARSIITEKMQLEGPSMRLLEVLCKYAVCRFFKLLFNFNHS
jgi:DNA replication licensing factor MCM4